MTEASACSVDQQAKDNARLNGSMMCGNSDVFEPASINNAKQRASLVSWLNGILPDLNLPMNATDEELRAFLVDGSVLCQMLNKLKPGSVTEAGGSIPHAEKLQRFLSALDEMGWPRFQAADLEKGSMKIVLDCLLTIQTQFMPNAGICNNGNDDSSRRRSLGNRLGALDCNQREETARLISSPSFGDERRKSASDPKFQRGLRSPLTAEPSATLIHHNNGHKFHEVFQLKQGSYTDLPAATISEMMKSNSLDNAPTQSLLSVVNGILDESVERKNGEIPHRVACLLRKVVQEIERRISTQAEHLRTQNNLFKAREEKYQSRIRVLEALATGTSEETKIVMNQLQQIKSEKNKMEEKKRVEEKEAPRMKEKEENNQEIAALKEELEATRRTYERQSSEMEERTRKAEQELENRVNEYSKLLAESQKRAKELEAFSESKSQRWNKKENIYHIFTEFQLGALRELRFSSESIRQEIVKTQRTYSEEFSSLGSRIRSLDDAAKNYYSLLAENRKLHNELQELKGNIRVYCRIRPFLPGQKGKQSSVEYIGDNGELIVVNPSKQGKEARRLFKFDKVYGQTARQADVFQDTQPLIQSVLDGYNVCIFAYGQTGSGKTYTMTGPDGATEEEWGVNYRALNNLFQISQSRKNSYSYEISVQMVEVYNEQVRDLLSSDGSQKKLGILSTMKPNGLAVPDASIHPVSSTPHVLELMSIGLKNRASGATALNERSSRSHSIVSIHVHGLDLKSDSSLRGSLHLVDLAGSERVDRSEVTGDRLKEAQHINKSLSALGDVIFALAQKSSHVPYRNSKLTQILQSSLGGHAKTLMFVQLNPDASSYGETISTLKFAERVSGVELGAAKSSKDGRDVRELMEQVASLKDTIAKKDEEIERLQLLKDQQAINSSRYGSTSPSQNSMVGSGTPPRSFKLSGGNGSEKAASDPDDYSEEADGSPDSSPLPNEAKLLINTDKIKTTTPRSPLKSGKDSPRDTTTHSGLRKSTSSNNIIAKTSRRWQ